MINQRHVIVFFQPAARSSLRNSVLAGLAPHMAHLQPQVSEYFAGHDIPGIVCRPTLFNPAGKMQVGFSFPFRHDGERVRSAVLVEEGMVARSLTPYEVMALPQPDSFALQACLAAIVDVAADLRVEVGVIGSVALEMATGFPYVENRSDLDFVVRAADWAVLPKLRERMATVMARYGRRADIELEAGDLGIKLDEVLSDSDTLIAKTIKDVRIVDRNLTSVDISFGFSNMCDRI